MVTIVGGAGTPPIGCPVRGSGLPTWRWKPATFCAPMLPVNFVTRRGKPGSRMPRLSVNGFESFDQLASANGLASGSRLPLELLRILEDDSSTAGASAGGFRPGAAGSATNL